MESILFSFLWFTSELCAVYCCILNWLHFTKFEYLDKKQLLRKPSEQQRLLEEVPRVIPEMEDSKDTEFQVTGQDKPIQKSAVALQGDTPKVSVTLIVTELDLCNVKIIQKLYEHKF